jgi:hypothetical protein
MLISITMIIKRKWMNEWVTPFAVLTHTFTIYKHRSLHVIINGNDFFYSMTIEVSRKYMYIYIYTYEKKHTFRINWRDTCSDNQNCIIYHEYNYCRVRLTWCNLSSNGHSIHSFLYTAGTCHWLTMSVLRLYTCIAAG